MGKAGGIFPTLIGTVALPLLAIIMVAGNSVNIPHSALDSVRTLTANIALEMSYATGLHRQALFATGVILLVVIIVLNSIASIAIRKRMNKK